MATARAKRPDPNVLAAAALLRCAPTWDAVLTAIAATRQQLAVVPLDVLDERIRAAVRAERAEQLISDREAAEVCGVHVRTWQLWVKEMPSLAALAEPGPGPRRWRLSVIRNWKP